MRIPHWDYLSWARDRFGAAAALASYPQVLLTGFAKVDGLFLRTGTSDLDVYDEVFRTGEYAIDVPEPKFVIDAGAHIGLASVYFTRRWPKAKIVAIELERSNYALMMTNVSPYPNIIPLYAGLWSHQTLLEVANPGAATWSFRATEGGTVRAVTIPEIMGMAGVKRIDLLKIDIEGGEKEVLEHSASWIDKVDTLIIETHDRYVPGCTDALKNAIAGRRVAHSVSGESTVLRFS